MSPEQAQTMLEGADFDGPLVHADNNGHQVELLGIESVNGGDAYKLQVTMKTGGVQTHYVDTETFYVTRVVSAAGDAVFLDYRIVDGHPVPSVIEMKGPMGEQTIYLDDVKFGVEIDDSAFRMQ
jgi:outer membrane lipoprotein-sorting protein